VAEGRVLAVADNGQFVRVMSIDDGQEIYSPLATKANNWNVWIRTVGPRMYVINSQQVLGYSLDHPDDNWTGTKPVGNPTIRDAFIGKNHIVLLDQPTPAGVEPPATSGHFRLLAYGRYPKGEGKTGESGKFDQSPDVTDDAGIDQWQPVDGGFYYRSVDRKAHFLKGSAPRDARPAPTGTPAAAPKAGS